MIRAVKAEYNRKTKSYTAQAIDNVYHVSPGWMIYCIGDEAQVIDEINRGRLIYSWKPAARAAVLAYLQSLLPAA